MNERWVVLDVRQLPIIVQQQEAECNLQLIARQESSRTSVISVAESQMLGSHGGMLPMVGSPGLIPQPQKAIGIEVLRFRVQIWIAKASCNPDARSLG